MLKLQQQNASLPKATLNTGNGDIDADLKNEFLQELKRLSSEKEGLSHDIKDEFAKEVERLSKAGTSSK
jgi:hypothetical protein